MSKRFIWMTVFMVVATLLAPMALVGSSADAADLKQLIEKTPQGTGKGQIDPKAEPGFLGIPGGPKANVIYGLLWGIWVGWIFSTVGAFGGIMAGVGHITVFGFGDYASSFKSTNPALGKTITDSIRCSNQWLVGLSGVISSLAYYRMGRLVLPLGISLAIGSVGGALLIPYLTAGKISLTQYVGYFGLLVFVLSGFLIYKLTPMGQRSGKKAKQAAANFEQAVKAKKDTPEAGVKVKQIGLGRITFTFYGVEFGFSPILAVIGGLVISAISAFLGVGGGFLLVPYITAVVGLPMFIAAGTSAFAVLISMIVSIISYMVISGVQISWGFIGMELIGIFIGSLIGPKTSKYVPDKFLQILFILTALYVGIGYTTKGFLGGSWLPGL